MTDIGIKYQWLLKITKREKIRHAPPIIIPNTMYSLDKGIKPPSDSPSGFSSQCVRNIHN